tara:strand:+ start:5003 stop:5854 length:852 start_codon:yes stop_codon:yes gene_type:complete
MRYKKISKDLWIDLHKREAFSSKYYKDIDGKKFNFLDKSSTFLNGQYGISWYKNFYNRMSREISKFHYNNQVIYKKHNNKLRGKKVLILGAGPSSMEVEWQGQYDYIITSNNYYKKFKATPYMITFTPYINLFDQELNEFLLSNDCFIGLETEFLKPHEIRMVSEFHKVFEKRIVTYQTRYCSAIGVSTRQAVLAVLLGASEVHLCGLDLFKNEQSINHCFEDTKSLPNWRKKFGIDFQDRQVIAFWFYINQIAKLHNCKVINISENSDHNCMSFITREYSYE